MQLLRGPRLQLWSKWMPQPALTNPSRDGIATGIAGFSAEKCRQTSGGALRAGASSRALAPLAFARGSHKCLPVHNISRLRSHGSACGAKSRRWDVRHALACVALLSAVYAIHTHKHTRLRGKSLFSTRKGVEKFPPANGPFRPTISLLINAHRDARVYFPLDQKLGGMLSVQLLRGIRKPRIRFEYLDNFVPFNFKTRTLVTLFAEYRFQ